MNYPPGMTLRPIDTWPGQLTSDAQRKPAPFEASFSSTMELLHRELRALGPYGLRSVGNTYFYPRSVLQVALRERDFRVSDGMPRADSRPSHPGVILTIEPKDKPALSFPCDTFTHWHHNLRAIALTLEALRKVDRYGVTQTGQQYRGWQAIESAPSVDVLSAARALLARVAYPDDSIERQAAWADQMATSQVVAGTVVKRARRNAHPDRNGGDQARWDDVEQALEVLGLREARVL